MKMIFFLFILPIVFLHDVSALYCMKTKNIARPSVSHSASLRAEYIGTAVIGKPGIVAYTLSTKRIPQRIRVLTPPIVSGCVEQFSAEYATLDFSRGSAQIARSYVVPQAETIIMDSLTIECTYSLDSVYIVRLPTTSIRSTIPPSASKVYTSQAMPWIPFGRITRRLVHDTLYTTQGEECVVRVVFSLHPADTLYHRAFMAMPYSHAVSPSSDVILSPTPTSSPIEQTALSQYTRQYQCLPLAVGTHRVIIAPQWTIDPSTGELLLLPALVQTVHVSPRSQPDTTWWEIFLSWQAEALTMFLSCSAFLIVVWFVKKRRTSSSSSIK